MRANFSQAIEDDFFEEHYINPDSAIRLPWQWRMVDPGQVDHLHDWQIATGLARRFRSFGKQAFFRSKTFSMSPGFCERLKNNGIRNFSYMNTSMALKNIESIVFVGYWDVGWRNLLQLPERLEGFTRLKRLDHIFGNRQSSYSPFDLMVRSTSIRRQVPEELLGLFRRIGVKVDDLDMGIIDGSPTLACRNEIYHRHSELMQQLRKI
ncbi:hypothetical protein PENANT_c039G02543 [Penicillium antarcticum]|uniref:Uncharacterized protein n=1 Tax=Penicillium antarcticum TaxID=416450 RepID=A0A1V6PT61_9EURO|nr:hypothetical protein PENANT_c039G02543 [Penicillium antarcticum]